MISGIFLNMLCLDLYGVLSLYSIGSPLMMFIYVILHKHTLIHFFYLSMVIASSKVLSRLGDLLNTLLSFEFLARLALKNNYLLTYMYTIW